MVSGHLEYHKWFSYLFCFVYWSFLNKEYHLLSIPQGLIYIICILSSYLHINNHKITPIAYYTPSTQILTHSTRNFFQNFSSKLYFQPQHLPRIRTTIYFILLIGLSCPQVTTQTRLIYHNNKVLHIHNSYTTPRNNHPTHTIQHMSPAHNTTKSIIFHTILTQHIDIPHLTTHFQTFPPHTSINYLHNTTHVNHPYIEYPQWPHHHNFKYLSNSKYQPHSNNTTASAYRPRHTNNRAHRLINNCKSHSITNLNSINNTKSPLLLQYIENTTPAIPNLFTTTKFTIRDGSHTIIYLVLVVIQLLWTQFYINKDYKPLLCMPTIGKHLTSHITTRQFNHAIKQTHIKIITLILLLMITNIHPSTLPNTTYTTTYTLKGGLITHYINASISHNPTLRQIGTHYILLQKPSPPLTLIKDSHPYPMQTPFHNYYPMVTSPSPSYSQYKQPGGITSISHHDAHPPSKQSQPHPKYTPHPKYSPHPRHNSHPRQNHHLIYGTHSKHMLYLTNNVHPQYKNHLNLHPKTTPCPHFKAVPIFNYNSYHNRPLALHNYPHLKSNLQNHITNKRKPKQKSYPTNKVTSTYEPHQFTNTKHYSQHKCLNNKHPHKLNYLLDSQSKYRPHPTNTTASAYRPRHSNNNEYYLIINWNSNSITRPNFINNTKSHFSPQPINHIIPALPNLYTTTKFTTIIYHKINMKNPKTIHFRGYYFINILELLKCGDIQPNPGPMPNILHTHPATHKKRATIYFIPNTIKLQPEYQHIANTFAPILTKSHPLHHQAIITHPHLHQYIQTQRQSPPTHMLYAIVITIHPSIDTCNNILA